MIQLQITLFDRLNKYKPVSTLVKVDSVAYYKDHAAQIKQQGIIKICQQRYWTIQDLKEYNYTLCKVRVYKKEK